MIKHIGNVGGGKTQSRSVYLTDGISPTLSAGMTHGNTVPYILCSNERTRGGQRLEPNLTETTNTITTVTKDNLILEIKQIGNISPGKNRDNPNQGRVYDPDGLSPTLSGMQGGGRQPHIIEPARVVGGLGQKKSNGGSQYFQQDRVYSSDGLAMCLPASIPGGSYNYLIEETDDKDKTSNQ